MGRAGNAGTVNSGRLEGVLHSLTATAIFLLHRSLSMGASERSQAIRTTARTCTTLRRRAGSISSERLKSSAMITVKIIPNRIRNTV